MHNLTTIAGVVADIIENMSEADKATIVNTPENDLILITVGAPLSETTTICGGIRHW